MIDLKDIRVPHKQAMVYNYLIIPGEQLIMQQFKGGVSKNMLVKASEKIMADPAYDHRYTGIIDIRPAELQLDGTEMIGFAKGITDLDRDESGKRSILATNPVETALVYLFGERMAEQMAVGVFSTEEKACSFIGKELRVMDYLNSSSINSLTMEELV